MSRLTVGKVSDQVGMTADTVRYYEREGLIPPPRRGESGYRIYSEAVIERLKSLRRARNLGFGLKEIKELLAFQDNPDGNKKEMKLRVGDEIEKITARIDDLTRMRDVLEDFFAAYDSKATLGEFRIVEALQSDAYNAFAR